MKEIIFEVRENSKGKYAWIDGLGFSLIDRKGMNKVNTYEKWIGEIIRKIKDKRGKEIFIIKPKKRILELKELKDGLYVYSGRKCLGKPEVKIEIEKEYNTIFAYNDFAIEEKIIKVKKYIYENEILKTDEEKEEEKKWWYFDNFNNDNLPKEIKEKFQKMYWEWIERLKKWIEEEKPNPQKAKEYFQQKIEKRIKNLERKLQEMQEKLNKLKETKKLKLETLKKHGIPYEEIKDATFETLVGKDHKVDIVKIKLKNGEVLEGKSYSRLSFNYGSYIEYDYPFVKESELRVEESLEKEDKDFLKLVSIYANFTDIKEINKKIEELEKEIKEIKEKLNQMKNTKLEFKEKMGYVYAKFGDEILVYDENTYDYYSIPFVYRAILENDFETLDKVENILNNPSAFFIK